MTAGTALVAVIRRAIHAWRWLFPRELGEHEVVQLGDEGWSLTFPTWRPVWPRSICIGKTVKECRGMTPPDYALRFRRRR
jgi:hypothetical protein